MDEKSILLKEKNLLPEYKMNGRNMKEWQIYIAELKEEIQKYENNKKMKQQRIIEQVSF